MDKQILNEHQQIFLNDYTQNFEGLFLHPEAQGDLNSINYGLYNIYKDLKIVDSQLIDLGNSINNLLSSTVFRLESVKTTILQEKERYQDIQMLCNKYSDFDNVNSLDVNNFAGNYSCKNNIFFAQKKKSSKTKLKILDIDGNGYEGNNFVYNNYEYQKDTYDTSIRNNLLDDKINTYYEYSRITIPSYCEDKNSYFNSDDIKAQCTISFEANDYINYIELTTEDTGVIINNIQYSVDGIKYTNLNLKNKISINNKLDCYSNYGYIYGSGILMLPTCKFFKITFETTESKTDTIAYEKASIISTSINTIDKEVVTDFPTVIEQTKIVQGAKRSVIKLNDVVAYKYKFNTKTQLTTDNLIENDIYSVALFSNVYIPEGLENSAVKFYLIINGVSYEVIPLNSQMNGTKILRFSGNKSNNTSVLLLTEVIKSVKLNIVFENTTLLTPFINSVKLLIGGEV